MHLLLAIVALGLSGALQAVISPPLNWWWLHTISFIPAIVVLDSIDTRGKATLAGWWIGISANAAIFYWVVHTVRTFSNLPYIAAVGCLLAFALVWGFYAGVWGWGFKAIQGRMGDWWPVGIAAWFAACEYLNPQLFPYYQGVTWYQLPAIFLIVAVAGVPFISFLIILCNATIAQGIIRTRAGVERPWGGPVMRNAGLLAALVAVSMGYSHARLDAIEAAEADAEISRIALVQSNRDVFALRAMSKRSKSASLDDFIALSRDAIRESEDLDAVVWPEGALRGAAGYRRNAKARRMVRDTGVELWTGGTFSIKGDDGRRVHHNSAFRIYDQGKIDERHDKNILLPFGEFMPLEDLIPILKKIQGVGNYHPGEGLELFETPHGDFVFLICYEAIRHRYVRGGVRGGADLLVNITYDAWFGDTSNPTQHLMLSAVQSAQYGIPLIRSATTGISAHVDARGMIVQQTEVFERDVLVADVKRVSVPTPYASLGDWFAWLCIIGSALLLLSGKRADERPWKKGHWAAWTAITVGTLLIPKLAWLANPYILVGDWIAWGAASGFLVAIGVLRVVDSRKAKA
ncbi:MAG: apolipoprotein N-acyltransferase [Proteobacteria bacterium]|nr:apolipoprotein N-acyltransferase [Pseudomonadota bacterium]